MCVCMHACMYNTLTSLHPPLQLSSALLFDAVYTVVAAVQELNRSQNVGSTQLSCKSSKIWEHGTSLMNYLRMVRLIGMTQRQAAALAATFIGKLVKLVILAYHCKIFSTRVDSDSHHISKFPTLLERGSFIFKVSDYYLNGGRFGILLRTCFFILLLSTFDRRRDFMDGSASLVSDRRGGDLCLCFIFRLCHSLSV